MNTADSQRLASRLEDLGYVWSPDVDHADVVVLNTCVVRQQAEEKVCGRLGALRSWKAGRPDRVLALMGCLVGHKVDCSLADRFPHVDVLLAPSSVQPLLDLLQGTQLDAEARDLVAEEHRAAARLSAPATQDEASRWRLPLPEQGCAVTAYVPIVAGCSHVCAYCIVPSRRGPEHSRSQREVLEHVQSLVDQGVRQITLLGQIVDRYGYDRGEPDALPRLLVRLGQVAGLDRIRFLTSHPAYVTDLLLDAVATVPTVMEQLEVPVQSGHDEILTRMRRGYTVAQYCELVGRIRARVPASAVHTDVIVGFPGETEAEFLATYRLLADLRLDKAHIARFSPRPGTLAAVTMADDVPATEKEQRRSALDRLQESISAEINAAQVGRTVEVLVEGRHRDRWRSRTRTNKLVFFHDPRPCLGRTMLVSVTWACPWSMIGRPADASAPHAPGAATS
jgi:tRNA-2-methylthio-N6-dimethylallyladenosine synthase